MDEAGGKFRTASVCVCGQVESPDALCAYEVSATADQHPGKFCSLLPVKADFQLNITGPGRNAYRARQGFDRKPSQQNAVDWVLSDFWRTEVMCHAPMVPAQAQVKYQQSSNFGDTLVLMLRFDPAICSSTAVGSRVCARTGVRWSPAPGRAYDDAPVPAMPAPLLFATVAHWCPLQGLEWPGHAGAMCWPHAAVRLPGWPAPGAGQGSTKGLSGVGLSHSTAKPATMAGGVRHA